MNFSNYYDKQSISENFVEMFDYVNLLPIFCNS